MNNLEELFTQNPYSMDRSKKNIFFKNFQKKLILHHYRNSQSYRKILNFLNFKSKKNYDLKDMPFLPVRLFKNFDLLSVDKKKIIKTLNSSGTTGNKTSKIYLDRYNSLNQVKALQKIMHHLLGNERLPMLIVDQDIEKIDRLNFSARIAAINGFSIFGKNYTYLLDSKGEIDYEQLNNFLKKYGNKKFLIFGFTSIVYQNFLNKISEKKIISNFENGVLIHGGGWKKLTNLKVSNKKFKARFKKKLKLEQIYNYYGLVEQTGSIFIECKCGYFISSNFSDIIIRDEKFNELKYNQKGFIQLFSLLPSSYPGHIILTEDVGEIVEPNNCNCSINGKRFLLHGRIEEAEIRGCSDV